MIVRRVVSLAVALLLFFIALAGPSTAQEAMPATPAAPALSDLQNLEQFRSLFDEQRGKPRLLLLISPT